MEGLVLIVSVVVGFVALSFVFRSFWLWYWNLNKISSQLEDIIKTISNYNDEPKDKELTFDYLLVIKKNNKVNIIRAIETLNKTEFEPVLLEDEDFFVRSAPFTASRDDIVSILKEQNDEVIMCFTIQDSKEKYNLLRRR